MRKPVFPCLLSTALAAALLSAPPAHAYKFPGEEATIGSALAAKVIGQHCANYLTAPEATEIDAYIAKASVEMDKKDAVDEKGRGYKTLSSGELVKALTQTYATKYRDPANCNVDSKEEARDTLEKVRKSMAAGGPTFPDEADPAYKPHTGAAISAKVTGEKCAGTLTGLQLAELDYFIARGFLRRARTSSDGDSEYEKKMLMAAEKDMSNGWRAIDCTPYAVGKAKAIAGHVSKDVGKAAP